MDSGAWIDHAPKSAIICGLKELPEDNPSKLMHRHIYFAHCFKHQDGWKELLARFRNGGGSLYDLEFLTDAQGRRVAAFGVQAGIAGSAVGLLAWAQQQTNGIGGSLLAGFKKPFDSFDAMVAQIKSAVQTASKKIGRLPRVIVFGALGRCGKGAISTVEALGLKIEISKWDLAETKRGGPFIECLQHDIMVNCIYLMGKIPAFITNEYIQQNNMKRKLSVLVDVSCDYTSPFNPLPVYNQATTLTAPTVRILKGDSNKNVPDLDVCSIDHLPTLLPREASNSFSDAMLPYLMKLHNPESHDIYCKAVNIFHKRMKEAQIDK